MVSPLKDVNTEPRQIYQSSWRRARQSETALEPVTEAMIAIPERWWVNTYPTLLESMNHTKELGDKKPEGWPTHLWETVSLIEWWLGWTGTLTKEGSDPYLGWGNEYQLWAAIMWILHACVRRPCHELDHVEKEIHEDGDPGPLALSVSPRLGIFATRDAYSQVGEGSGKTYTLEQLLSFCPNPTIEIQTTGPALARIIGEEHATLGLDEGADYFINNRHAMSRNLLESGYRQSDTGLVRPPSTSRMWGNKVYRVDSHGPVILAALATPQLVGSATLRPLMSRFIKLFIKQAPPGYRPPKIKDKDREVLVLIKNHLHKLMMSLADVAKSFRYEDLPEYLSPRKAEIWEPLFCMAGIVDLDLANNGQEPYWVARMTAVLDWMEGDAEQRAKTKAGWESLAAKVAEREIP